MLNTVTSHLTNTKQYAMKTTWTNGKAELIFCCLLILPVSNATQRVWILLLSAASPKLNNLRLVPIIRINYIIQHCVLFQQHVLEETNLHNNINDPQRYDNSQEHGCAVGYHNWYSHNS